jgi:hypothetical protein
MSFTIDIERLSIALTGVSRGIAEQAVAGLDAELRRRLGNTTQRALVSGDLGVMRIGPIAGPATNDPSVLRDLIADRLILALSQAPAAETREQG